MDVRLSAEQAALEAAATQLVDQLSASTVADLGDTVRAGKLVAAVASSGWHELRVESDGGAPLASGVEVAIVAEELGRGLADAPFTGPTLAAELRRLAGAPSAAEVETVLLAPGLAEVAQVTAHQGPGGGIAVDAQGATRALFLRAMGSEGYEVASVPLRSLPRRDPLDTGDPTDLTRLTVPSGDAAPERLPGQARLLTDEDVRRWTALGLATTSADLVGVMRGAVELARAYAIERRQYGAAIGSFQAVQHLLADALVAMEGSRSATLHAAWAVDSLPPAQALLSAAGAKAYSARAARQVCETAIQVHGGIGNTWDCLAHVFLRRALLSIDILGGAGPNLARVLACHGVGGFDGLW
ncbi:MAG TPA: acyl-CoA dehydrogenase family protein [Acidimicrobiales bacterium]|jgi:alkylation response protein AidB-like acyl-CoA dehydrogenase|nr:acyl-CoA dehydrogenase family protein [Acidimicrobiales bacterium]